MLELRHLRHALALAKHRNFARAAEALHLTQPSLSRSIAALEEELGVLLFDRSKSGIRPTAYGELLLQRGAALLEGEADFRREIQLLAGLEAGTLCIGAGPFPAEISVGTAVARLLRAHPRLRVEVLCADPDEITRRVLAGQFDVGIGNPSAIAETPRLRFEQLPSHRAYLACRPGIPLPVATTSRWTTCSATRWQRRYCRGRRALLRPVVLAPAGSTRRAGSSCPPFT